MALRVTPQGQDYAYINIASAWRAFLGINKVNEQKKPPGGGFFCF